MKKRKQILMLVLCGLLLSVGCVKKMTTEQKFNQVVEEYAVSKLQESPITASFTLGDLERYGIEELASQLDHFELIDANEEAEKIDAFIKKLKSFDEDELSKEQKKDLELFLFQLKYEKAFNEFTYISNGITPSGGFQVEFPIVLMQIEFDQEEDILNYLKRVKELPRLFDEIIAYEKERQEKGYTLPAYLHQKSIEQMQEMVVEADQFLMYQGFEDRIHQVSYLEEAEKERYKKEFLALVEEELIPMYEELIEAVTKLKEASLAKGSISEWEDGQAYYETLVRYNTSDELDVEGLRKWAEGEFNATLASFQQLMMKDPKIIEVDFENLLPTDLTLEDVYKKSEEVLATKFKTYPVDSAVENVIPSYLEEYLAAAFYLPITIDGEDYGNMFFRQSDLENPTVDTLVTMFHENIPGHHLYYSYIKDSDESLLRKMVEYLPYEEGYAQYVQDMAYEYMGLEENVIEFLRLNSQLIYAYMVQLDIALHYDGKSGAEIKSELMNFGYDEVSAQETVDRMISKPGEMIHYMYGAYKMKEFKKRYQEIQGSEYDEKEFHEMILEHYGMPFYILEEEME